MNRLNALWAVGLVMMIAGAAFGGGTLVVCDDVSEPLTLDPHRQFSEKNHTLLQQVYEGLVRFGPEGEIEPALAVSWERVDGLRMRFHLREGVSFHNGEPFTAEAVRFTIERYLDPGTGFPAAGFIAPIAGAEVVGPHTVDIVTEYPDGLLLNRLAAFVLVVPPELVREGGSDVLEERPVGTGPFRFVRWVRGREVRLDANREYWMPDRPRLDGLVFRFVPAEEQVELLLRGEVDLVTELPGTMTTRVMAADGTVIAKQRTFWTVGATMNTGSGPLSDVRVRRALNHALDRETMIRFGSRGNGQVLATLTMEGQEGHNPDLEPYEHDLEKANRLLDEAGAERPLVLKTLVRMQTERTARIIAAQLLLVGVHLDIQAVESDQEAIGRLRTEEWELVIGGGPDPMHHSLFLQSILLFSRSPFSLQQDAEFDRRLMEMAQALDQGERERLGRELDRYVHEQALSLFTYQKIRTYGKRAGVEFTPYISGMPHLFDAGFAEGGSRSAAVTAEGSAAGESGGTR